MTLAPVLTSRHCCRHPLLEEINRRLDAGTTAVAISAWLRTLGPEMVLSRQAIRRHVLEHRSTAFEQQQRAAAKRMKQQQRSPGPRRDLAERVVEIATDSLEAGTLTPTLREALVAQKLLDDRQAHGEDTDLMRATIALIISGVALPPGMVPELGPGDVEGEAHEVPVYETYRDEAGRKWSAPPEQPRNTLESRLDRLERQRRARLRRQQPEPEVSIVEPAATEIPIPVAPTEPDPEVRRQADIARRLKQRHIF